MSIILKMFFAVFLALLVSASVESAALESAAVEDSPLTRVKREIETEKKSEVQTPAPTTFPIDPTTQTPSTTSTTTEKPVKICEDSINVSCGWAVYTPFTREIKYFMKNACECPELQHCVRVDDDPVISAFVYKCRVKRTTPAPPTTE